jgi:hypothetical protein
VPQYVLEAAGVQLYGDGDAGRVTLVTPPHQTQLNGLFPTYLDASAICTQRILPEKLMAILVKEFPAFRETKLRYYV